MKRYVFAVTGASGAPVGLRVLRELVKTSEVHLLVSSPAFGILRDEAGVDWHGGDEAETTEKVRADLGPENIHYWSEKNFAAPVSSGSFPTDGMLVVPCTMKTLAGVAGGYAETLVERAADVTIKEGRQLLLSPREMPFSAVHLENMLKLAALGVRIAPPVPAFYFGPESLGDMVDFLAGKVLDAMGVEHGLYRRWEGRPAD
ncbi:MAG: UbiX family flavin prenyltransferase [Nitrospirota bacterium]|jgi:4-hydroxy-3-polyprenylbenzoate decarboxylase